MLLDYRQRALLLYSVLYGTLEEKYKAGRLLELDDEKQELISKLRVDDAAIELPHPDDERMSPHFGDTISRRRRMGLPSPMEQVALWLLMIGNLIIWMYVFNGLQT